MGLGWDRPCGCGCWWVWSGRACFWWVRGRVGDVAAVWVGDGHAGFDGWHSMPPVLGGRCRLCRLHGVGPARALAVLGAWFGLGGGRGCVGTAEVLGLVWWASGNAHARAWGCSDVTVGGPGDQAGAYAVRRGAVRGQGVLAATNATGSSARRGRQRRIGEVGRGGTSVWWRNWYATPVTRRQVTYPCDVVEEAAASLRPVRRGSGRVAWARSSVGWWLDLRRGVGCFGKPVGMFLASPSS